MKKLGVIGVGYWGPNLIRNFHELGYITAVCDKNKTRLEEIKQKYSYIALYSNIDKLLNDIDAVVIATEVKSHYSIVKKALLSNKDVFVEKPFTLKASEGEELKKIARDRKLILMVGHILLYHPGIIQLKEYIENGTLGKIHYIYTQRLNLGKISQEEDVLWSLGPHDISIILYLLETMPEKVVCSGVDYLQPNIPDVVFLTLYFPNKILANIHLSWLDPNKVRTITIVGDKQMVRFDDIETTEKLRLYDKGVDYKPSFKSYSEALTMRIGNITIPTIKQGECLKLECKHFIECIEKRKEAISDAENGIKVVRILETAQKSIISGGTPIYIDK